MTCKKIKLLVVDDDIQDIQMIEHLTQDLDYLWPVEKAESHMEALTKLAGIDLIFLDVNLNGVDGKETLKLIKKRNPNIVVIMLSTSDFEMDIRDCLMAGADAYLTKPFEVKELKRKIDITCRYWFHTIERHPNATD